MSNISISIKNNTDGEIQTKAALESIISKYNLDKWVFCKDVVIEQGATGKAFPIIRLSAWVNDENRLLAQFLHEEFHWIEKGHEEQMNKAIEELKSMFPSVPISKPEGGGSEKSTYIHLVICRLEFLALQEVLGEEKAITVVSGNTNYTWIRKNIIDREIIHFPRLSVI